MSQHRPIWDRGGPIDEEMLAYTIGEDWLADRELVPHELRASLAHGCGLHAAGLLDEPSWRLIRGGLEALREAWERGEWDVGPEDEDVHSAVERRLIDGIGEAGKRLHLGRSRNDQVAVDIRLWLREAAAELQSRLGRLGEALAESKDRRGALPLPGYTHMRRAMPSSVGEWLAAHQRAFADDLRDLAAAARRWSECPLGSGAGFGVPLPLDRGMVSEQLGFIQPEEPVTYTQHSRGRAELAYLTVLESIALDLGKLATDLWHWSTAEFGFVVLPEHLTTGSSMMPHKRNPDLLELIRAHCRQIRGDRSMLLAALADLPSGYHRDFQLLKPPLFRAHRRLVPALGLMARLLDSLEFSEAALRSAVADPDLQVTGRALSRAAKGEPFRDVYRDEARSG